MTERGEGLGGVRWAIKSALSTTGQIVVVADSVRVTPAGDLMAVRLSAQQAEGGQLHMVEEVNLILAAGKWQSCVPMTEDAVGPAIQEWGGWAE